LLVFNRLEVAPHAQLSRRQLRGSGQSRSRNAALVRDKTRASCAACTIGCEHIYSLRPEKDASGEEKPRRAARIRESLPLSARFVASPIHRLFLAASQRCDELGIDTISAGGTIAFAMECVERGLLDEPWLRFGDGDALLKALDLIGKRQGFGDRLAEGSRLLAESIGGDTHEFAPHVKGLEIPGYEPRALQSMALGFAVGSAEPTIIAAGPMRSIFSERADRRNLQPERHSSPSRPKTKRP